MFITPRESSDSARIEIEVPNVPDMIAVVRGVLLQLTKECNWEQIEGVTISPAQASAIGEQIFASLTITEI